MSGFASGRVIVVEGFDDLGVGQSAQAGGWLELSRTIRHTFLGGSMAMASFCGMEICTGLAESCLSLLRDRRNWAKVSVRSSSRQTPVGRTTMDATHLDHGRSLGSSTSESGCGKLASAQ